MAPALSRCCVLRSVYSPPYFPCLCAGDHDGDTGVECFLQFGGIQLAEGRGRQCLTMHIRQDCIGIESVNLSRRADHLRLGEKQAGRFEGGDSKMPLILKPDVPLESLVGPPVVTQESQFRLLCWCGRHGFPRGPSGSLRNSASGAQSHPALRNHA